MGTKIAALETAVGELDAAGRRRRISRWSETAWQRGSGIENMELTELRTQIHTLSRREKYLLIQLIVLELAQEDTSWANGSSAHQRDEVMETLNARAVDKFLGSWKGCLKGVDPDEAKQSYLMEKYQ